MKNVAVILAGGSGRRMGEDIPKQFMKIAGKKVVEHTIDAFENHDMIDEIAVVVNTDFMPMFEEIVIKNNYKKLKKILNGGSERYHSSLSAINAYDEEVNLIFHDSVRPLVNNRIITDCIKALDKYNAVDVAIPTTDTIINVGENKCIESVPPRATLRNGQTPQAFKRSVIKKAYDLALLDSEFKTTDDCGVVLKYLPEEPVFVVDGELFNMKLTYKDDLFLLDKLFQLKSIDKGNAFECYSLDNIKGKVVMIFGGTLGIGKSIADMATEAGADVYSVSRSTGVDVSDATSVKKAFKDVYDKAGRIDYVINTAGILGRQPLESMTEEEILNSISVNYIGAVYVAKESFRYLKDSKGMLLCFTSSSYTRGRSLYSLYSSSKAAIVNLVQALSEEWLPFGIRVNCINPERTRTPMRTQNCGIEPEGSLLEPEVVAAASLTTLLSELTGDVIDVKK